MFLLVINILPLAAWAAEGITCNVQNEGGNVNITGNTFPNSLVSLVVTRVTDSSRSWLDQTNSDENGDYSFSFALDGGDYRAIVSCNGLYQQNDLKIKTSDSKTVTVRVEGKNETKLSQTEVTVQAGQTTLFEAITSALDSAHVGYEITNGLINTIDGEEGWQWIVNNQPGMTLPSTTMSGGEEIVLIDDQIWDPVITQLTVSQASVSVGTAFTVTLEGLNGSSPSSLAGQPVFFDGETNGTDSGGQAVFTPKNKGSFAVTCQPLTANLIRPMPVMVNVTEGSTTPGGGGGTNPDNNISVSMRIEGYRGTIIDGYVSFNPDDYKGSDGKYHITDPDGVEHVNDCATVLLATMVAWNQNGIRDNSVGYDDNYVSRMAGEEEFDFKGKHITSGWLIRLNNYLINQGVGVWPVKDGDKIEWYYGDINSYFGSIEVSPTSLKTGEKIKVKVSGQSNGGMSMSNTGNKEPMEGATVYVGTEEYITDSNGEVEITMNNPGTFKVYAVKTDQNSAQGGYYFPLMSKTKQVSVTVTGNSMGGGGVSVPENSSDAAGVIKTVMAGAEPDEALVSAATKAAATSLVNNLQKVKTADEANKLLQDTIAVTGLLDSAAERIISSEPALAFTGACQDIAGVLGGLAPQVTGKDAKKNLAETATQVLNAAVKVLVAIADKGKLEESTNALLDCAAKILQSLDGQQTQAVEASVLKMAQQAAACLVRETLAGDAVQSSGDLLKASVNPELAGELAGYVGRTVADLQQKLLQMGIGQNLQLAKKVIIDIPNQSEKTVEITLPAGTMESVASNGADSLRINTSEACFNITPETFGTSAQGKDIALTASMVDPDSISGGVAPEGSIVVDLKATVGGKTITGFSVPMELSIPYTGTPQDPSAVAVFLLKDDDGSLEPVGGLYDPDSGTVKFLLDHFSKYLAKEALKQFTDLTGYPWAKEAVTTLAGKGIISGKSADAFDPGANITRAEFASLITRMLKQKAPEGNQITFKDVDQASWYHNAVAAAQAGGLISGVAADRFNPEGNITREEMATIIARVLLKKGYDEGKAEALADFQDKGEIASWASSAAALAVREGIINGTGDGRFAPKNRATRAEASVMLDRLYQLVLR